MSQKPSVLVRMTAPQGVGEGSGSRILNSVVSKTGEIVVVVMDLVLIPMILAHRVHGVYGTPKKQKLQLSV
jgi:hypothetical protein